MSRRRRFPRYLRDTATPRRKAAASGTTRIAGPVAEAWLGAVESALATPTRALARRRLTSAHIGQVKLAPGSARIEVRQEAYHRQLVDILMPELDDGQREHLLEAAGEHGRWLAALAAGDVPPDLAVALVDAGLVPDAHELVGRCTCRTLPGMCVHTGIAGHVVARALSIQPAVMLTLRGLPPERIREHIVRRLPGASEPATRDPANIDWNQDVLGSQAPPPAELPMPRHAGRPAPLPSPPPRSGLAEGVLDALAVDAADRALVLLRSGGNAGLDLVADADLARRAAGLAPGAMTAFADRAGMDGAELAAMAAAWRVGRSAAVEALRHSWRPAQRALEPGLSALRSAHAGVTTRMNRVTSSDGLVELALGRDGLWYLLRRQRRRSPATIARPGAVDPLTLMNAPPADGEDAGAAPVVAEQMRLPWNSHADS